MIARAGMAAEYVSFGRAPDDLPPPEAWLSQAEQAELACWRDAARREQWLAGRRLAKRLVARVLAAPVADLRAIEVRSRDGRRRSGRPEVRVHGRRVPWSLSLSHTERGAMAILCYDPDATVGVDLVVLGRDWGGLARAWFTPREQDLLRAAGHDGAAAIWAVKEAFYKAVNAGEPFAPRQFEVRPLGGGQYACVYLGDGAACDGEVHTEPLDGHVSALAVLPASSAALRAQCDPSEESYGTSSSRRASEFAL